MKKVSAAVLLGLSILIMSGCATRGRTVELSPELQSEYDNPLYCQGEAQCKEYWERATFYVSNYAGFKIQILSDTLIETYNPSENSIRMAYKISKEPLGNGKYQIWTSVRCANMFGCAEPINEAIAKAKHYIRTGEK